MNDDRRGREIEIGETTSVAELAAQMDVPASHLVRTGFEERGRLLTMYETLPFEQAKELVAHFGFIARRRV